MSDDEDDYMSDKVLGLCPDTKPGLIKDSIKIRQIAQEKKRIADNICNKSKPRHLVESETRNDGLSKALTSQNKGFKMLEKMGFKPGTSLGKHGTGRLEPVGIDVKSGRSGLGRDSDLKRKNDEKLIARKNYLIKRQKAQIESQKNYRSFKSGDFRARRAESDLRKSQKVCYDLDSRNDIKSAACPFYWPAKLGDESNDEEEKEQEEENLDSLTQLTLLTTYLRTKYFYCIWCGTVFTDTDDLLENCPGDTSDHHE